MHKIVRIILFRENFRHQHSHFVKMIILDECARILSCTSKNLCDKLNSPIDRSIILKELLGRKVQTTYRDEHGFYHAFTIKGLTTPGADSLQAY